MVGILLFFILNFYQANNAESSFHMKFEKCELANYNKEWIKDMVITCTILNETHFKVDGSGHLLKDMNFDDVVVSIYN